MSSGSRADADLTTQGAVSISSEAEDSAEPDKNLQRIAAEWADDATDLREASRDGVARGDDAKAFDEWLRGGTVEGTLYRGVTLGANEIAEWEVGDLIDQKGISSWTRAHDVAQDFAKQSAPMFELMNHGQSHDDVIFRMEGTKRGRSIAEYSTHPEEEEVTISASSRQRITGISTHRNGMVYIDVEEIV